MFFVRTICMLAFMTICWQMPAHAAPEKKNDAGIQVAADVLNQLSAQLVKLVKLGINPVDLEKSLETISNAKAEKLAEIIDEMKIFTSLSRKLSIAALGTKDRELISFVKKEIMPHHRTMAILKDEAEHSLDDLLNGIKETKTPLIESPILRF